MSGGNPLYCKVELCLPPHVCSHSANFSSGIVLNVRSLVWVPDKENTSLDGVKSVLLFSKCTFVSVYVCLNLPLRLCFSMCAFVCVSACVSMSRLTEVSRRSQHLTNKLRDLTHSSAQTTHRKQSRAIISLPFCVAPDCLPSRCVCLKL